MAFEGSQPVKLIGALAGADLSAATNQYRFVKYSTTNTGRVVVCSATTDRPCGVLQGCPPTSALDQPVEIVALGQTKLQSDGTLQVGNIIMTNASGQGTPCLATGYPVGEAADPNSTNASVAGDYISAVVNCIAPTVHA